MYRILSAILIGCVLGCGGGGGGATSGNSVAPPPAIGSFQAKDIFSYGDDYIWPSNIAFDPSGNIFVAGYGVSGPAHRWLVRRSVDGGTSWTTSDDFQYAVGFTSAAKDIAIDSAGNIYVIGTGRDSSNISHWIVRKSTDGGASWSTIDDFEYTSGYFSDALAIAIGPSDNIYVAGGGQDSSSVYHWVVRKSSNGGSAWTTTDNFQLENGFYSIPSEIDFDSSGRVFVVGTGKDNTNVTHWLVRQSVIGSNSWATLDNYISGDNGAYSVAIDSNDKIYVVGNSGSNLLVRRSLNSGVTWTTVENYQYLTGNTYGFSIAIDSLNNLYISGNGFDSGGKSVAIVRASSNGTDWSNVDTLQYTANQNSFGRGIAIDSNDNVWCTAQGETDGAGHSIWITRMATAPPP